RGRGAARAPGAGRLGGRRARRRGGAGDRARGPRRAGRVRGRGAAGRTGRPRPVGAGGGDPAAGDDVIRVLLADDEHLVRTAIATLLGLEPDIEVVAQVGRGDEVAAAVAAHDPDVVVLDIEMPGMDGLAVAESLPGRA